MYAASDKQIGTSTLSEWFHYSNGRDSDPSLSSYPEPAPFLFSPAKKSKAPPAPAAGAVPVVAGALKPPKRANTLGAAPPPS